MKFSLELLHKPIVNADKNEIMGRVHGYIIDPERKHIAAFVLEKQGEEKTLHVVPFSSAKTIYNDAIIVENLPGPISLSDAPELMDLLMREINIVGATVITDTGMLAGNVRDYAFSVDTGNILFVRISNERGVPEFFEANRILKVTRERMIVSASMCDPDAALAAKKSVALYIKKVQRAQAQAVATAPAPEKRPEPLARPEPAAMSQAEPEAQPVPQPAAPPASQPQQSAPAPQPESPTPRVDAARMRMTLDDFKKDFVEELEALYNSHFKEEMRNSFQEALRLLFERMSHLDPEKQLEKFHGSIMHDVKELLSEMEERRREEDRERAIEAALENKLGALVDSRMEAAEKRLEGLEASLQDIAERQAEAAAGLKTGLESAAAGISGAAGDTAGKIFEAMRELSLGVETAVRESAGAVSKPEDIDKAVASLRDEMDAKISGTREAVDALAEKAAEIGREVGGVSGLGALLEKMADETRLRTDELALKVPSAEKIELLIGDLKSELNASLPELLGEHFSSLQSRIDELAGKTLSAEAVEGHAEKLREELTRNLPDMLLKNFAEVKSAAEAIEIKLPAADRFDRAVDALREELTLSLPELFDKHSEDLKRHAEDLSANLPTSESLERFTEYIKEEIGCILVEVMQKHLETAGKQLEVVMSHIPPAETFNQITEKLRQEFSINLPMLLEKYFAESKLATAALADKLPAADAAEKAAVSLREELVATLDEAMRRSADELRGITAGISESMPTADALDKTADKIKYELSLILPELLQKNFEELKHRSDELSQKLDDAADVENKIDAIRQELSAAIPSGIDELKSRADALAAGVATTDAMRMEFDNLRATLAGKIDASREDGALFEEKVRAIVFDALNGLRGSQAEQLAGIVAPIRETLDFLKEQPGIIENMVEGSADRFDSALASAVERLRSDIAAATPKDITDRFNNVAAAQGALSGRLRETAERFEEKLAAVRAEVADVLRAELSRHTDANLEKASSIKEAIGRLEAKIAEAREAPQSKAPDFGAFRAELLEELRSAVSSGVKRGELDELRGRMEEAVESLGRVASEGTKQAVDRAVEEFRSAGTDAAVDAGQLRHDIEKISAALRERIDALAEGLAGGLDIIREAAIVNSGAEAAREDADAAGSETAEKLVSRIEKRMRDDMDRLVDFVDRRIGERDEYLEDAFRKFAEAIEGLVSRAPRGDIGDLFSGRLFGNLFGGAGGSQSSKLDPARRITPTAGKPGKTPATSGPVEAAQVRRLAYLIGKTVVQDISDREGNVIVRAGTTVDEEIIRVSRDAHRVLDLIRAVDLS